MLVFGTFYSPSWVNKQIRSTLFRSNSDFEAINFILITYILIIDIEIEDVRLHFCSHEGDIAQSVHAIRPQQKLMASLPSFTGMRLSKLMPAQLEGKIRSTQTMWIKLIDMAAVWERNAWLFSHCDRTFAY